MEIRRVSFLPCTVIQASYYTATEETRGRYFRVVTVMASDKTIIDYLRKLSEEYRIKAEVLRQCADKLESKTAEEIEKRNARPLPKIADRYY